MRRKEASSAVAHFITGVLDADSLRASFESLLRAVHLAPGDRVKTLRGSMRGVIVRMLDDGRVALRRDGAAGEIIALPESLVPDD